MVGFKNGRLVSKSGVPRLYPSVYPKLHFRFHVFAIEDKQLNQFTMFFALGYKNGTCARLLCSQTKKHYFDIVCALGDNKKNYVDSLFVLGGNKNGNYNVVAL